MALPTQYRRIRKLNEVTIPMILLAVALALIVGEMGPTWLIRVETNRVVKSYTEQFERRRGRYLEREDELETLTRNFSRDLRQAGVSDPDMEYWIEIDEQSQAHLGVIYVQTYRWPLNIGTPFQSRVEQMAQSESP